MTCNEMFYASIDNIKNAYKQVCIYNKEFREDLAARPKALHLMIALDARCLFKRCIAIGARRTNACVNWELK